MANGEYANDNEPKKKPDLMRGLEALRRGSGKGVSFRDLLREMYEAAGIKSFLFEVVWPIKGHLNSLRGYVAPETVNLRKVELRKLSDDELKDIARNSNHLQWSAKPAYYRALVEVIEEREGIR